MRRFVVIAMLALAMLAAACLWPQPPSAPDTIAVAPLHLLVVGDPFAAVLERQAAAILGPAGLHATFERAGYDATRRIILAEHEAPSGAFDLVAFDVVWTAELARRGALLPVDELCAADPSIDLSGYLQPAMAGLRWEGRLYGLPIQPHAELLWGRSDLLATAGLAMPRTPADLLAAARALHRPEAGVYGIVWNAQRGSALGQTMAHLYAAFGQRLLDDTGRPTLDGPGAQAAASFVRDLVAVSPPDILTTAWDQRRRRFIAGQAALTFEWGARMGEGLRSADCQVAGKVVCAPPPVAPGVAPVASFGTWCLGIPASARPRSAAAWRALAAVCGPAGARRLAEQGNAGVALRALLDDSELGRPYAGLFPVMRELDTTAAFSPHVRPNTPYWDQLCHTLGEVFHEVLSGGQDPATAPAEAQRRALELWSRPVG
jgi:multiple sugar transport system substrate-binding protein